MASPAASVAIQNTEECIGGCPVLVVVVVVVSVLMAFSNVDSTGSGPRYLVKVKSGNAVVMRLPSSSCFWISARTVNLATDEEDSSVVHAICVWRTQQPVDSGC